MSPVELFIEVRCEEIPARFVAPAIEGFAANLKKLLGSLIVGPVQAYSTPRRLALRTDVLPERPSTEKLVTGMPLAQAQKDGEWTPAALAFAKKKGVDAADLIAHNGFVAARVSEGRERTSALLTSGLEAVVLGIPFKKTMRWGESPVRFARPLHDVACLLDGSLVHANVAGITTAAVSVGHPVASPARFGVTSAKQWLEALRALGIYADRTERRERIQAQLQAVATPLHLVPDPALLDEVTDLVERPFTIQGTFPEHLLRLPSRLLIESMKVNQRYFPLFNNGVLTHRFLVVTNNPEGDPVAMAEGNARVLAARFHDAQFFYAEDKKRSLAQHAERLGGMVWIRGLGTMAERQAQIAAAAMRLAVLCGAEPAVLTRLGPVLKADLGTLMVGEFPELQGHVGALLAAEAGFAGAVAIEEAWLPRYSGDALPATPEGLALALAERITLLSACFVADMEPKGSADPQGLRRAAVGLVALHQRLGAGTLDGLYLAAGAPLPANLREFILARFRNALLGDGHAPDIVDAVLAVGAADLPAMTARVRGLASLPAFEMSAVRTTFRRVAGLARDHSEARYALDLLQDEPEYALHRAILALPKADADLLPALRNLRPVVDAFFDAVLVMSDDPPLRQNRLGLLRSILDRFGGYADFSRLGGES